MATLEKKQIQGKYGKFWAYMVSGDTLPLKDSLKKLGFKWYGPEKVWWISDKKFTDLTKQSLINLGITDNATNQQAQQAQPNPLSQPTQPTKAPLETKQWTTEDEEMSKWYGFPINKNILSYKENMPVDDKTYEVNITIDRSFQEGKLSNSYRKTKSREHKGLPKYLIHLSVPELNVNQTLKKISKQQWGRYNEEEYLKELQQLVKQNVIEKANSRLHKNIQHFADIKKRTPEYKQFLNDINNKKVVPEFNFQINDPLYGGNYKITVDDLAVGEDAGDVYLNMVVDSPNAPSSAMIYDKPDIMGTYTIEDFNNRIKQNLQQNHDKIQTRYIEYLKSFPFLQSQQEEAQQSFDTVKRYILQGADSDSVLRVLQEKGYIRPHKRQKQMGPGLTGGEGIKWVLDSKKIVNDAYSSGYTTKTPDYFYSVVAYYIHRKVRGIWSWTDMMLVDSMDRWLRTMNNMGAGFNFKEVEKTIEQIGNQIINKVFGNTQQNQTPETPETQQSSQGLQELTSFAQQYGIPSENIEENSKMVYRNLAQMLHPDKYPDPAKKDEMTRKFQQLQDIWDRVPQQYKAASNWYEKYVMS